MVSRPPRVWTVVVGGGTGSRFGRPKQYESLGSERVIDRARRVAESASDGVVLVVPASDAAREGGIPGGSTRSESVRAGLAEVPDDADIICVHDAARPLASIELYGRVIGALVDDPDLAGAVPAVPVADTVKVIDSGGEVLSTPDRSTLVAVQTPQAFRAAALRAAHAGGDDGTDDAALVERIGGRVVTVPGEDANRKITHPDDVERARSAMMDSGRAAAGASETR